MRTYNPPSAAVALAFAVALVMIGGAWTAEAATVACVKNDNFGVGQTLCDGAGPSQSVHVKEPAAQVLVENQTAGAAVLFRLLNGGVNRFQIQNTAATGGGAWNFAVNNGNDFAIDFAGVGGTEFRLDKNGNLTISGSLSQSSSVELKRDFEMVEGNQVLERVMELPILGWSYKTDRAGSRHMGPMAEDFRTLFGLGADEKHLAASDVAGVALAAIQGLNEKVERLERDKEDLQAELARLRELIEARTE